MSNVDRFLEARRQREQARVALQAIAEQLREMATKLAYPEEASGFGVSNMRSRRHRAAPR